jgi:hypothetical protein
MQSSHPWRIPCFPSPRISEQPCTHFSLRQSLEPATPARGHSMPPGGELLARGDVPRVVATTRSFHVKYTHLTVSRHVNGVDRIHSSLRTLTDVSSQYFRDLNPDQQCSIIGAFITVSGMAKWNELAVRIVRSCGIGSCQFKDESPSVL